MFNVLKKLGLQRNFESFNREKITPEIVCKLSAHDFEILGISNRADMMKLRIECVKYGPCSPNRLKINNGFSMFDIPKFYLDNLLENGFKIADIANLLQVSESTIYRRMVRYGLSKREFSDISDEELDKEIGDVIKNFPLCGESILRQMVITNKGIRIQRWRLREAIHRIDATGVKSRKAGRLQRRVYNVQGPNQLWHIDSNHKLVRWRFIVIGGIHWF